MNFSSHQNLDFVLGTAHIDLDHALVLTPAPKSEKPNNVPATPKEDHQQVLHTQSGLPRAKGLRAHLKPDGGRWAAEFDLLFSAGKH